MSPDVTRGSITGNDLWKRYRADRQGSPLKAAARTLLGRARVGPWVLQGVNVRIEAGESVGVVGLNGSGKSTLLKVLAGVTTPNSGRLAVGGRIGALIEVRAGIHPELSGRENIFFYGTVLGLSRRQVAERFQEIVDFGELGHAIDRQVKFYSSGMQMRLGFSIAAFLEPDVLLVDEALAVGDIGFQQRCIERMQAVVSQGTTLVFVSHDMAAVGAMCDRVLWMDAGRVRHDGSVDEVMSLYRQGLEQKAAALSELLDDPVRLEGIRIKGDDDGETATGRPVTIAVDLDSTADMSVDLCLGVSDGPASPIFALTHRVDVQQEGTRVVVRLDNLPLPRGRYYVWIGAFGESGTVRMAWHPAMPLDVSGPMPQPTPRGVMVHSSVHVSAAWTTEPGSQARSLSAGSEPISPT